MQRPPVKIVHEKQSFFFILLLLMINSLQLTSSDQSRQSFVPSQTQLWGMQTPFWHVNLSPLQGSPEQKTKNKYEVNLVSY